MRFLSDTMKDNERKEKCMRTITLFTDTTFVDRFQVPRNKIFSSKFQSL
jgi:hypothetical protein